MNNIPIVITVKKEKSITDKLVSNLVLVKNVMVTVCLINYVIDSAKKGKLNSIKNFFTKKIFTTKKSVKTEE